MTVTYFLISIFSIFIIFISNIYFINIDFYIIIFFQLQALRMSQAIWVEALCNCFDLSYFPYMRCLANIEPDSPAALALKSLAIHQQCHTPAVAHSASYAQSELSKNVSLMRIIGDSFCQIVLGHPKNTGTVGQSFYALTVAPNLMMLRTAMGTIIDGRPIAVRYDYSLAIDTIIDAFKLEKNLIIRGAPGKTIFLLF